MTTIKVYCKSGNLGRKRVHGFLAWEGDVSCVPHAGDFVVLWDGWSSSEVLDAHYDLEGDYVFIEIGPDLTGECLKQVEEVGYLHIRENKETT